MRLRGRREKVFGPGHAVPLDRNSGKRGIERGAGREIVLLSALNRAEMTRCGQIRAGCG
jgi:hypothetical protein